MWRQRCPEFFGGTYTYFIKLFLESAIWHSLDSYSFHILLIFTWKGYKQSGIIVVYFLKSKFFCHPKKKIGKQVRKTVNQTSFWEGETATKHIEALAEEKHCYPALFPSVLVVLMFFGILKISLTFFIIMIVLIIKRGRGLELFLYLNLEFRLTLELWDYDQQPAYICHPNILDLLHC